MMTRIGMLILLVTALPLVIADEQPEPSEKPPDHSAPDSDDESTEDWLESNPELRKLYEKWLRSDSFLECDSYLTANESDEFCSVEIPEDWEEFEFNGESFFIQPLS